MRSKSPIADHASPHLPRRRHQERKEAVTIEEWEGNDNNSLVLSLIDTDATALQQEVADSRQLNQRHDWECKILAAIDDPKYTEGLSFTRLRGATNIKPKNLEPILDSLTTEGVLEHVETTIAHNQCWVWRRPR